MMSKCMGRGGAGARVQGGEEGSKGTLPRGRGWRAGVSLIMPLNMLSNGPSIILSNIPSNIPSIIPSNVPSIIPSNIPSTIPLTIPSNIPSTIPGFHPGLMAFGLLRSRA